MGRILVGNLSRVTGTQGAAVTNPCFPSGALRPQPSRLAGWMLAARWLFGRTLRTRLAPVTRALVRPTKAIGPAKHFVGRRAELAAFAEMREAASETAMPQLAVVQAPPGAGKTALLAETAARASDKRFLVIETPVASLTSPELLRARVVPQLSRRDRWKDLLPDLKLEFPGGLGGSVSLGRPGPVAVSLLLDGLDSLSQRCGLSGKGPAGILLLLDEAQRLARRDEAAVDLLLEALRGQAGLRTLTILAGLPDTLDALDSPSLARADRMLSLGPLRRTESVDLLGLWLADNGFSAAGPEPLDEIAAHAQDWPEHLVHHIAAMLREAAANGGVVDAGVAARSNTAAEPAMREYYNRRLGLLRGRPVEEHHAVTALALAAGKPGDGLSGGRMQEIIRRSGAGPDLSVRLAHAGVLVDDGNRWRFTVSSLRTHVLRTKDPLPSTLAAAVEEVVTGVRP